MCDTCGCNVSEANRHLLEPDGKLSGFGSEKKAVDILEALLSENNHQAQHNRQHLQAHGILALNLMSSPGSGKTALLEATIDALKPHYRMAVIEGDLETENDARRIRAKGIPAVQIVTGSTCHLDAHMVHHALHQLPLEDLDIIFIENVGNLVCPAGFDLGHHRNVSLLSVTEGDDKPEKYPLMFRGSDAVIFSKTDLLQWLDDFDPDRAEQGLRGLANPAPVFHVSAKIGTGMEQWLRWLDRTLLDYRQSVNQKSGFLPRVYQHSHVAAHASEHEKRRVEVVDTG
ncbi:MAG: hydrogenase nickel incorporation protein HypB [Gammaproteobacteria bacterium]|nr:hydrogenase nickel incorporation protein HypB [Gammaproteobacteria bacterium]MDH5800698.1 hydrogenase nickel incorporation protein HypB [Gammaproteobacteria bacterium]